MYGITTIPQRRELFLRSTSSLARAGFDSPIIFTDGRSGETLGAFGNWLLSLMELWIRDPSAERYALFQDDLVAIKGIREYLDKMPLPHGGYYNLYAHPDNKARIAGKGWNLSDQCGKGALALIFDRGTVLKLLTSRRLLERPLHPQRGWRFIDGGVSDAMRDYGIKEYFHYPSLVAHTGILSTMSKADNATLANQDRYRWPYGYEGLDFPGEEFNAMEFLK